MKQTTNAVHVEGYVFSHALQNRVSKKGVPFIMGDLNIATNDDFTNVVPVHFTYVTETFAKSGKPNPTYDLLMSIIDAGGSNTAEACGQSALKVRIDGDIEVNDFVTRDGEMASPKRIRGSFVHAMTGSIAEHPATFDADMVIGQVVERENEDSNDYATLHGYVFNFRGDALPVDLNVRSQTGIDYFLDQEVSNKNPLFTHLRGEIVSQSIVHETTEESAFGDPIVHKVTRNLRTWDVTWASTEPYEFGEEGVLTAKELKQKVDDREEHLAEVKKNHDDYMAARDGGQNFLAPKTTSKSVVVDDFDDDEFDDLF